MRYLLVWLCLVCASFSAMAHKPSDSYLAVDLDGGQIQGQWDIALRDLEYAMGLDSNGDGNITWLELREHRQQLFQYALSRLDISADRQACPIQPAELMVDEHSDGHYAVLKFQARCPAAAGQLALRYGLFFDIDPQHRGLLKFSRGAQTDSYIFSPDRNQHELRLNAARTPLQELLSFAYEGVSHIWIGFDHILFLLSLLLPAALVRENRNWLPKPGFSAVFADVLCVVTAFTLAHTLTLSLTALHYISLPSRWVESAIAASVALAALNNIFPRFHRQRTWFAFGFGLIHGMGIAGVLLDMGLPAGQGLLSLLGFNLGVEAGQLIIVCAALPLIAYCSRLRHYPAVALKFGSASIAGIAFFWLVQRGLDIQ